MRVGPRFIKRMFALLSFLALVWVILRLWRFENWDYFRDYLKNHHLEAVAMIAIQLVLLTINLVLESQKWKILVSPIANISIAKSFSQILKGIQLGLITPARTGEPVGKAVFFRPAERTRVMMLSLAGSIIQNGVIFFAAVPAFLSIDGGSHPLNLSFENYYSQFDSWWMAGIVVAVLIAVLIVAGVNSGAGRIIKIIRQHLKVLKHYQTNDLIQVTFITIARFLVFSFQLYLLLRFFGLNDIQNGLFSVFMYYGALSFLPSAGAGDLGVRSTLALLFFGQSALTAPAIVMASLFLWFLNLGIPALIPLFSGIQSAIIPKVQNKTLPT